MDDLSDEALIRRYGEGDAKAFEVLYHRHKDAVYRFVRRQCRDRETTRDIVQEIWGKLIRACRRYRPEGRFAAYLLTLAHNRMVNHRRAQAVRRPVDGAIVTAVDIGGLPGRDEDNPDARAPVRPHPARYSTSKPCSWSADPAPARRISPAPCCRP